MVTYYCCVVNFQIEVLALLGCGVVMSGTELPTFQDSALVLASRAKILDILTLEDGTDTLPKNVGNSPPNITTQNPITTKTSTALKQKTKISQFKIH
jgi:hypothetical protein